MLKNFLRVAALVGLATASVTGSALAQSKSHNEVNSTAIKLGFFSPGDAPARRVAGAQILSFEADLVAQYIPERNETSVFSIGYIERDGLRLMPLTISQIHHDNKSTTGYNIYYGYGLGLYSARLKGLADTSGTAKTLIGAVITGGVNLSDSTFVEAKYHYPAKYDSKFVGGVQVMFGLRL